MPHLSLKSMIANLNLGMHTTPRTRTTSTPRLDLAEGAFQSLGDVGHVRIQGGDFVKVSEGMHFVLDLNGGEILVKVTRKFAETLPPSDKESSNVPWFVFIEPGPNMSTLQVGNSFTLFIAGSLVLVEVTTILRKVAGSTEAEIITPLKTWCVEGISEEEKPHVLGTPLPSEKPLLESSPKVIATNLTSKNHASTPAICVLEPEAPLSLETDYQNPRQTPRHRSKREAGTNITHSMQEFTRPSPLEFSSPPLPRLRSGPTLQPYPEPQSWVQRHSLEAPVVGSMLMQSGHAKTHSEGGSTIRSRGIQRVGTTSSSTTSVRHRRTSSSSSSSSTRAQLGLVPQPEVIDLEMRKSHRKTPATSNYSPKSGFPSQLLDDNMPLLPPFYPSPARSKRLSLPVHSSNATPVPQSDAVQRAPTPSPRNQNLESPPRERSAKDAVYHEEKRKTVPGDQSKRSSKPRKDSTTVEKPRQKTTRDIKHTYEDPQVEDLLASTKTPLAKTHYLPGHCCGCLHPSR